MGVDYGNVEVDGEKVGINCISVGVDGGSEELTVEVWELTAEMWK